MESVLPLPSSPPLVANFCLRFLIFQAFEKGVLWLQLLGPSTLICQGRFSSLKIFQLEEKESATWLQLADFLIRYGRCVRCRWLRCSVPADVSVSDSVADPGCLSRIPDPDFYPSRISDPRSRIQKQQQKRGVNIFFVIPFYVATSFTKL